MKILLIVARPGITNISARLIYPPFSLQQLAAITPKKHQVQGIDEGFGAIKFDKKTIDFDIVGISCMTHGAVRAYELADYFKSKGKTVVLGGWHPSALPEEAKQHADSVVIGEAEDTWPQLLKDYEQGKLKPYYYQEKRVEPEAIPPANRNVSKGFYLFAGFEATRGCNNRCEFCAITSREYGRAFRPRPKENVINEIKTIKEKNFAFHDASLSTDLNYTKSLFKELAKINKKFIGYANINILNRDEELLNLARKAGCIGWCIGFDSISQETLNSIHKSSNKARDYKTAIKKIHDNGMMAIGSLIFGFDTDTPDVFRSTLDFVKAAEIDNPTFNVLTPFPGTPLFKRLDAENRILTRDWSKYDLWNVVFKPKNITEEDLLNGVKYMHEDFYSRFNHTKRLVKSIRRGFYPFILTFMEAVPAPIAIISNKMSQVSRF